MAPPPSQKGKFRPKKPKKVTTRPQGASAAGGQEGSMETGGAAGASSGPAAAAAAATSTSTVAFAATTTSTAAPSGPQSSFSGRGYNQRGRGGRGRGRGPGPQGKVFFTGGERIEAPTRGASSSSSSRTASAARRGARSAGGSSSGTGGGGGGLRAMDTSTEEVVGQLETAIGASGSNTAGNREPTKSRLSDHTMEYEDEGQNRTSSTSMSIPLAMHMYDSDSSDEESRIRSNDRHGSLLSPLELPFPAKENPQGVGSSHASAPQLSEVEDTPASPFVSVHRADKLREEKDSWFLVQLPTRLAPLQKRRQETTTTAAEGGDPAEGNETEDVVPSLANISEVCVPPVTTDTFDNALETAAPGRIGKILVYKSGKTVLVMDGQDGKEIELEVNEGLTCSFKQEIVAVDTQKGQYISLGDVKKSVVVSPDLSCIMDA
mmetsp:Transcript_18953/g.30567  ORF Transcript_18953/g.30567 Transcript_18953/m.30567 type:complete len:434 (-) Transcript_18953:562-1863(-)